MSDGEPSYLASRSNMEINMPELPEVETIVRQLAPRVVGRCIERVEMLDAKLGLEWPPSLLGCRIDKLHRLGKQIILELDGSGVRNGASGDPRRWLCIHLRMTGRLIYDEGLPGGMHETAGAIRARIHLDRGLLVFQDVRRFGTMRLATPEDVCSGGIDPTAPAFTARRLRGLIAGSRTAIKPWLLRQDKVAGLGNIYACEALFQAGLSPLRSAGSIDAAEAARLCKAIRGVLKLAIDAGGTTFSDYRDGQGGRGRFQNRLAVYGREGEPCRTCGAPVVRIVQGGRSTFFCPACQDVE